MEQNLTKYIEDLNKEHEKDDSRFEIGYPINIKGHNILGKAKRALVDAIPFLLQYGNPFIVKPYTTTQCVQEEIARWNS